MSSEDKKKLKEIKEALEWYLIANEDAGVVYVPKFAVDSAIKNLKEILEG